MELPAVDPVVDRLVGATEPEKVRSHHPVAGSDKPRDHAPIQISPGRLAVETQHDRAFGRANIDVMHPQPAVAGQVFEVVPQGDLLF